MSGLRAPFPWFGGKSLVASVVWRYFGDVDNYVEPFAGSLAVLLARPTVPTGAAETINDLDHYLANFWRALQAAPEEVARYADWPVNEDDLTARHIWLVNAGRQRLERIPADPDFYDAKIAGWWVWGICSWIGSGWCSGAGPWQNVDGVLTKVERGGVRRKLPHLGDAGQGINRNRPHLGNAGQGINRNRPHLGNAGQGQCATWTEHLQGIMRELADRLRRVRVCCGDWQRVVTAGALSYGATVGVFLDPPYAAETGRNMHLYNHETEVSAAVRAWAIANGDNPRYRIALCGYAGEHVMPDNWQVEVWTARAAYKTHRGDKTGNRTRERIWFSPACSAQPLLGLMERNA